MFTYIFDPYFPFLKLKIFSIFSFIIQYVAVTSIQPRRIEQNEIDQAM